MSFNLFIYSVLWNKSIYYFVSLVTAMMIGICHGNMYAHTTEIIIIKILAAFMTTSNIIKAATSSFFTSLHPKQITFLYHVASSLTHNRSYVFSQQWVTHTPVVMTVIKNDTLLHVLCHFTACSAATVTMTLYLKALFKARSSSGQNQAYIARGNMVSLQSKTRLFYWD